MKTKKYLIVTLGLIGIYFVGLTIINNKEEIEVSAKVENTNNTIIPKPLSYEGKEGKFTVNKWISLPSIFAKLFKYWSVSIEAELFINGE